MIDFQIDSDDDDEESDNYDEEDEDEEDDEPKKSKRKVRFSPVLFLLTSISDSERKDFSVDEAERRSLSWTTSMSTKMMKKEMI